MNPPTVTSSLPAPAPAGLVAAGPLTAVATRASRVLVYDQTGVLAGDVKTVLAHHGRLEVVECRRPRDLADLLTDGRFDVLLAGPGLDSVAGWERLRIIREELPRLVVVLAVANADQLEVRAVTRAGAVDLLELPTPDETLRESLDRAIALAHSMVDGPEPGSALEPIRFSGGPHKRVITVASASGGCGKTFLATNLAWFLTHHAGRKVCIVDLDLQFGEVSASLRLRPSYTITDLIQHDGDGDEDGDGLEAHFTEFCEVHESGISVLAAPRDPTEAALIRPADVGRVIDAARAHFDDVIIDTPPALADSVVVAYNRSDELFVLATLDIPSIRNMQVFLSTLQRLHVSDEGIRLILNKAESDAGVELRQVLKLFPQGFDATLPYAREVQRSINAGKPVLATNPTADISRKIGTTMRRLLPASAQADFDAYQAANRPSRFWLPGRRSKGGAA